MRRSCILLLTIIIFFTVLSCTIKCNKEGFLLNDVTNYFDTTLKTVDSPYSIAVLDTGFTSNKFTRDRVIYFYDFVNGENVAYDDNGHGTEIVEIICKLTDEKNVGYRQDIIVLKTTDKYSIISYRSLLDSLNWLCENYEKYNIRVVCMAFGFENDKLYADINIIAKINYLADNGVILVTSVGNNESMTFPALCDNLISVGSVFYNPKSKYNIFESSISSFSASNEYSSKPDLYAPGENIVIQSSLGYQHKILNGTSYSAGIVSAQIIYLIQDYNFNSFNEAKKYLDEFTYKNILTCKKTSVSNNE